MSSTENVVEKEVKETDEVETGNETTTTATMTRAGPVNKYFGTSLSIRKLLYTTTLVAAIVVVTSKQTELILTPFSSSRVPRAAKYNHSPGLVYFSVTLWIVMSYSILSLIRAMTHGGERVPSKHFLISIIFSDLIILGLLASAMGAGGGVAYIGYKGNSHVGWVKICHIYDKFCRHMAASLGLSLFASVLLIILIKRSVYSLYKQIP